MSLADEVRTVRQRVVARLNELEPLVREYEELLVLAGELGITPPGAGAAGAPGSRRAGTNGPARGAIANDPGPEGDQAAAEEAAADSGPGTADTPVEPSAASRPPIVRPPSPGRQRRRRSGTAAAGEPERDALVLETLRANPGATTAELASLLGVPATSLYRAVRELTSSGAIVKRGRGLYVAS
jgi:Winged helix-turn-helix DNA-binding